MLMISCFLACPGLIFIVEEDKENTEENCIKDKTFENVCHVFWTRYFESGNQHPKDMTDRKLDGSMPSSSHSETESVTKGAGGRQPRCWTLWLLGEQWCHSLSALEMLGPADVGSPRSVLHAYSLVFGVQVNARLRQLVLSSVCSPFLFPCAASRLCWLPVRYRGASADKEQIQKFASKPGITIFNLKHCS